MKGSGGGKSDVNNAGIMVKPEGLRKLSLCNQQAILSVLPGRTPELRSEENHANQITIEKKVSEKGELEIFVLVVLLCALCVFVLHTFVLYMDQEHILNLL